MALIDPERHADLIQLQRRVNEAFAELEVFDGDDAERPGLREQARQAAAAKQQALHDSGLAGEHGYHQADTALRRAAREAEG